MRLGGTDGGGDLSGVHALGETACDAFSVEGFDPVGERGPLRAGVTHGGERVLGGVCVSHDGESSC